MNNQAIAQVSRIEDYLMQQEASAMESGSESRQLSCYQAQLIMRMVAGDERYTLQSIMEVE